MATWKKQLGLLLVMTLLVACTDKRQPAKKTQREVIDAAPIEAVTAVKLDGKDTQVYQMAVKGTSLYVTGQPHWFGRWDLSADPEQPKLTFAASDTSGANGTANTFSPSPTFGCWTPDNFGSLSLAVVGPFAYLSGVLGLSAISIGETTNPVEKARYPMRNGAACTDHVRDTAFIYKALVAHPTVPVMYGFGESDYLYTLQYSGKSLQIIKRQAYGGVGGTVCCVRGATIFGNKLYVAFTSALWVFELTSSGVLGTPTVINKINPVNIVASNNHLYVHHAPTASGGSTLVEGVYVYDQTGAQVQYLSISPIVFSVLPNDAYLYANVDDTSVTVYKQWWTTGQ